MRAFFHMPRTLSSVNHLRQAVLNRPQPLSACSPIRPVGVQCVLWRSQVGMRLAPGVLEFLIILTWDNGRRSDCFRASRMARDETATVALQSFVAFFHRRRASSPEKLYRASHLQDCTGGFRSPPWA